MPLRAPVRPRFISDSTGDALTLEESVGDAVRNFHHGVIEIAGSVGAGKTFALRHLAAVLPADLNVEFPEADAADSLLSAGGASIVEVDTDAAPVPGRIARFDLAPWGSDEFIEYSLACHPEHCKSVIGRLLASSDRDMLNGCPELCSLVLDRLAADDTMKSVAEVLLAEIIELTDNDNLRLPLATHLLSDEHVLKLDRRRQPLYPRLLRLLRHEGVRSVAVAKQVSDGLNADSTVMVHALKFRENAARQFRLIELVCRSLTTLGISCIRKALKESKEQEIHGVLATMMFQLDRVWRPDLRVRPDLSGAVFRLADWPKADLRRLRLCGTDFSGACLNGALLIGTNATQANMTGTSLQRTRLRRLNAEGADFRGADLREASGSYCQFRGADLSRVKAGAVSFNNADFSAANLTEACFANSTLANAVLRQATLTGTDFSNADLTGAVVTLTVLADCILDGAIFEDANLWDSNLEFVKMPAARFAGALLASAILTGSSMPNADFRGARLIGAYLAEVDWCGADLRGANLEGATFHMGSSRSGLVDSHIASEGSRTGFYSNDYDDHHYRRPEDIRTANLCDCDLRGANLNGVDFYRVDLRGAKFDEHHRGHLVATGAFLD